MYKPNQGQIQYHKQGIKENSRVDGRTNNEQREIICKKSVLQQANGSSFVSVFDSSSSLYVGIKAEIINLKSEQDTGDITLKVDSMKRRDPYKSQQQQQDDQQSDSYLLKNIEIQIEEKMLKYINKDPLVLVKGKKAIQLNIDVFLIDYVNFCYIDLIVYGIRQAIQDLRIPEMKITHNYLTNEDEIDLLEDKMKTFSINQELQIPQVFTIGEVDNQLVFDLTLEEYHAVNNKFLVTVNTDGNICSMEKQGGGYLAPENIFRLTNFVQKQASILFQFEQQYEQQQNNNNDQNMETE